MRAMAIAVFSFAVCGCVANAAARDPSGGDFADVRHFGTLPFRETPFAALRGLRPMSAERAATRNHYRFHYDDTGRLRRVTFQLGERLREPNDTANFFFRTPRVDIDYAPGVEAHTYFDDNGHPMLLRGVYRAVYELKDDGWPRTLRYEGVDDEPVENTWGIARYEWSIADDGVVTERRFNLAGEPAPMRGNLPFGIVSFHYGPEGLLAVMRNVGEDGALVMNALNAAQDKLEYNRAGDVIAWNVLDTDGKHVRGNSAATSRPLKSLWGRAGGQDYGSRMPYAFRCSSR